MFDPKVGILYFVVRSSNFVSILCEVKMSQEISRSARLRHLVLENPEIGIEDVNQTFADRYDDKKAFRKQQLYQAKSDVRRRLGIEDFSELPKYNGKFNITGFLRKFFSDVPKEEAISQCEWYGLSISHALHHTAFKSKETETETETAEAPEWLSPNMNKKSKKKPIRKNPKKKSQKTQAPQLEMEDSKLVTYEQIESSLDDLLERANSLKDNGLIGTLKNARRHAGAKILSSK